MIVFILILAIGYILEQDSISVSLMNIEVNHQDIVLDEVGVSVQNNVCGYCNVRKDAKTLSVIVKGMVCSPGNMSSPGWRERRRVVWF